MNNDNDWTAFCAELKKHLETVTKSFSNIELPFDDSVLIKIDDNKKTEEEIEILNKLRIADLGDGINEKSKHCLKIIELLDVKDSRIKELKDAFETNKKKLSENYKNNKNNCDSSCDKIEKYVKDTDGFIYLLTRAFQNQHDSYQSDIEAIKKIVLKKKNDLDCLYSLKSILLSIVVVVCICAQVYLFSFVKGGDAQQIDVLGESIIVVSMVVLLICEVLFGLRINSLIKKKDFILQRLEIILNKIEMHKVSKFEIDRDLEKVLEEIRR